MYVTTCKTYIKKEKKQGRAAWLCVVGPSATSFSPLPCRTPALRFPAYAWRHRSWGGPRLVVVAFATATSYFPHLRCRCPYPVVGSAFARIPTHRLGSRCRPGLGYYPPPLGSRRRPWPPYPLALTRKVVGSRKGSKTDKTPPPSRSCARGRWWGPNWVETA